MVLVKHGATEPFTCAKVFAVHYFGVPGSGFNSKPLALACRIFSLLGGVEALLNSTTVTSAALAPVIGLTAATKIAIAMDSLRMQIPNRRIQSIVT